MALLLYSDPHFSHAAVIRYSSRPFTSIEEMNAELVRRYQAVVKPEDTVIWLGDCFFGPYERAEDLMGELPGRKILVRGNHDRSASRMAALGFDVVADRELRMCIADRPVRLCHFPYAGTASAEEDADGRRIEDTYSSARLRVLKGEVLIHGHTHSTQRRIGNMIHVGVDAWAYAPVTYAEVEALVLEVFA